MRFRFPSPPSCRICDANAADMKSGSGARELPPGLYALKRISSALKSVGLTITRAPFDSFHSTAPMLEIGFAATIFPAAGAFSMRFSDERFSVHAARVAFDALSNAARSPSRVGCGTPSLIGDCAMITRFSSVIQRFASEFTSARVIVGMSSCASLYSYSIPGIASPWR